MRSRECVSFLVLAGFVAGCDQSAAAVTHFTESVWINGDLLVAQGVLQLTSDQSPTVAPEIHWAGNRGSWVTGMDVANSGGSRDLVLAAKADWPAAGEVNDVLYVAHNDTFAPTVGVGVTPPDRSARLEISAQDSEPEMGSLLLRKTPNQQGNLLTINDSSGDTRWALDAAYWLKGETPGTETSLAIKGDDKNDRPLVVANSHGDFAYGFQYAADASGSLFLRYFTNGLNNIVLNTDGRPSFPNGLTTQQLRVENPAVPASSSSPCTRGDVSYDDDFVYVCIAANTWKRSALSSW